LRFSVKYLSSVDIWLCLLQSLLEEVESIYGGLQTIDRDIVNSVRRHTLNLLINGHSDYSVSQTEL